MARAAGAGAPGGAPGGAGAAAGAPPVGTVYLIGAGPGDPGLITVKGRRCLERADAVVHDRLANPRLLAWAPPAAQRFYVGKEPGTHASRQEDINALLISLARAGRRVARLKGGDPFVFGRGGEEALALAEAGIPFEVVPGVTSAVAAPAYAGIPVTHRGLASSVAFVTGHEDPAKDGSGVDWAGLARAAETIVCLMGVAHLERIGARLVEHGRDAGTPAAVVEWGTTSRQRTVEGTLADIAGLAAAAEVANPAVLIVGDVVSLRPRLAWCERRPLFGVRVLVTRARTQASALAQAIADLGGEPVELPVIEIGGSPELAALDAALDRIRGYSWVVFTSANAVEATLGRLVHRGGDLRQLFGIQVAAVGPQTAAALGRRGIVPDLVARGQSADSLADALLPRLRVAERILLPRSDIARPELPERLRRHGAVVDEVAAYSTRPSAEGAHEVRAMLERGEIHVVAFTSSSTVTNLAAALGAETGPGAGTAPGAETAPMADGSARPPGGDGLPGGGGAPALSELLSGVIVACIGPETARAAARLGLAVHVEAAEHTVPGLVSAIVEAVGAGAVPGRSARVPAGRAAAPARRAANAASHAGEEAKR